MPDGFTVPGHLVEFYPTGHTKLTLPTTGTLATLAGTETLAGKTLTTPAFTAKTATVIVDTAVTAAQSGTTFFVAATDPTLGVTITLPAVAAGLVYSFILVNPPTGTAGTHDHVIVNASGASGDQMIGYPVASSGADVTANGNTAGDQVNFVCDIALAGDRVDVVSNGTSWFVSATCKATGAITITG